ncbi:hypothetical protein V6N13_093534 [Hibiscus sabdariffa]|uniref:Uncharacterized protein n=1 Tax=Hibiscus sabdariffa TaxID=183260 RepID=A0ABR2NFV4_9ROSI
MGYCQKKGGTRGGNKESEALKRGIKLRKVKISHFWEPMVMEKLVLASGKKTTRGEAFVRFIDPPIGNSFKHTGARFVCVLSKAAVHRNRAKDSSLIDTAEFKTGHLIEILQSYVKIDFTLVDCKNCNYPKLFKMMNTDPKKAVVVANNLACDKEGLGGYVIGMDDKVGVKFMKEYRIPHWERNGSWMLLPSEGAIEAKGEIEKQFR